jgi:molybdopterin/thiamine biosynthesis adenylyltransferase
MAQGEQTAGGVHTLADGRQVAVPPHDEFYRLLITRNEGLVTKEDQERLRNSVILIAGCGSIGGAAVEPLIRMGAEHLVLVEPGDYDIPNMNRQSVRLQDVGRNKAAVFKERMAEINPYATITVDTRGVVADNAESLARSAAVILDGVDVTTKPPLRAKFDLHKYAQQFRVPVVSGYDIAHLQCLIVYDYRQPNVPILHGRVREDQIDAMQPMSFLERIVPIAAIPIEIIPELSRQLRGEREGFPQLVYTANLYGVLAVPAVVDLLAGRPVPRRVMVDVPTLMRSRPARWRTALSRLVGLAKLKREFLKHQRAGRA